jgi:oligopeptide transport system permease protein
VSSYIFKRLLQFLPVFLGATFLIYAMVYVMPGDPIRAMAGQNPPPDSVIRALEAKHNLDQPLLTQYWLYLVGLFQGDLGVDFNDRPVARLLGAALPLTLILGATAWLIEVVIAIPLGTWLGFRAGKWDDVFGRVATVIIMSIPVFVVGFAAQLVLGVRLGWFPVSGVRDGWPLSFILPALALSLPGLASTSRILRASIVETLSSDHVAAAIARGLPRRTVIIRHVMRNSLIPVVTALGLSLAGIVGGAVLIEGIFNIPGVGQLVFQAAGVGNGPIVVGVSTFLIIMFLLGNLLVDLLYGALDPRIRFD